MNVKQLFRPSPFRIGLLTGLVLFLAMAGLAYAVSLSMKGSAFNIEASAVGADLDRHGASRIVLSRTHGVMFQQTCLGGCDDLSLRKHVPEGSYELRVVDAKGACVACDGVAGYVAGGSYAGTTRWELKGQDRISARPRFDGASTAGPSGPS
ncbi:MAG: hypothetical protein AB1942_12795 [Pseudomonadota bacterium]